MFGAVLRFFRRKHSFAESVTNITVSFRKLPQKMEKEKALHRKLAQFSILFQFWIRGD
jgi:hypothetical protein